MKELTDLTTDEKTSMTDYLNTHYDEYNNNSILHLENIDNLIFLYDNDDYEFISFGRDLNDSIRMALKFNPNQIDINYLLEMLNIRFIPIKTQLKHIPELF